MKLRINHQQVMLKSLSQNCVIDGLRVELLKAYFQRNISEKHIYYSALNATTICQTFMICYGDLYALIGE